MSPKLSDALRGMADRAPMGEFSVSSTDAARRVRRHRTVRTTANSLVGAGAAAVVAFAIVIPSLGTSPSVEPNLADGGVAAGPEAAMDAMSRYENVVCGQDVAEPSTTESASLTIAGIEGKPDPDSSDIALVELALSGSVEALSTVEVLAVWDGIVVSSMTVSASEPMTDGDVTSYYVQLLATNCWDGAALPPGDYEIVAIQQVSAEVAAPPIIPEPSESPGQAGGDPVADEEALYGLAQSADANEIARLTDEVARLTAASVLVSEPRPWTIEGDVPDDPFASYLMPPPLVPDYSNLPEGFLLTDVARSLYEEGLVSDPWDMAEGTQRVVLVNTPDNSSGSLYARNFYGCSWDGTTPARFPTTSSTWNLYDVTGTIPSSISISYGFVVDDNPEFNLSLTNASGYTLPSVGVPDSTLLLVKDGIVVAQSYGTYAARYDSWDSSEYLAPAESLDSMFLWRDVDGCWNGGQQRKIAPGTYTVLNMQNLYISPATTIYGPVDDTQVQVFSDPSGTLEGTFTEGVASSDIAVVPEPLWSDFVEFQVWTSLGTVNVTTS